MTILLALTVQFGAVQESDRRLVNVPGATVDTLSDVVADKSWEYNGENIQIYINLYGIYMYMYNNTSL